MTPTRSAQVSIGPFEAPLGPVTQALVSQFVDKAERHGWVAIVGTTPEGVIVSAVRVDPARTVRQRVRVEVG